MAPRLAICPGTLLSNPRVPNDICHYTTPGVLCQMLFAANLGLSHIAIVLTARLHRHSRLLTVIPTKGETRVAKYIR